MSRLPSEPLRDGSTPHQRRIEAFMIKAEQEIPEKPCIPSEEVRLLRARLILEEALETVRALGFSIDFPPETYREDEICIEANGGDWPSDDLIRLSDNLKPNLVEIADGCADISVVTIGTLSACGIKDNPILEEVDRSNLAKFRGDAHKNEHGKWVKPSNWKPPYIENRLKEQGWSGE